MKIRELLEDKSSGDLPLELSAVVNQIASRVIDTGTKNPTSIAAILSILNDLGINLTVDQFKDMANNPPLNNIIANVAGNKVTFIGQKKSTGDKIEKPGGETETLEKMAKRAEKKRK